MSAEFLIVAKGIGATVGIAGLCAFAVAESAPRHHTRLEVLAVIFAVMGFGTCVTANKVEDAAAEVQR